MRVLPTQRQRSRRAPRSTCPWRPTAQRSPSRRRAPDVAWRRRACPRGGRFLRRPRARNSTARQGAASWLSFLCASQIHTPQNDVQRDEDQVQSEVPPQPDAQHFREVRDRRGVPPLLIDQEGTGAHELAERPGQSVLVQDARGQPVELTHRDQDSDHGGHPHASEPTSAQACEQPTQPAPEPAQEWFRSCVWCGRSSRRSRAIVDGRLIIHGDPPGVLGRIWGS